MDESNLNWILAIVGLLIGIGSGALGYHWLHAGAGQRQRLRQRLAERDRELAALKEGLDEHFSEVTRLVETLQQESDALARRLNQDAEALGNQPQRRRGLDLAPVAATADGEEEPPAPRDYADGTRGTLSEDFGLKRDEAGTAPQPPRY